MQYAPGNAPKPVAPEVPTPPPVEHLRPMPDLSTPVEQEPRIEQERPAEQLQREDDRKGLDKAIEGMKRALRTPKKKKSGVIPQVRDEVVMQVEKILEEDLADAYSALTPIQKQEFKIKGEQTAFAIREVLKKTHVSIKKIFTLILDWLKMLPGVNRFFLEQEAKIKADKIVALHRIKK